MSKELDKAYSEVLKKIKYSTKTHNKYRSIASNPRNSIKQRKHAELCSKILDKVVLDRINSAKNNK